MRILLPAIALLCLSACEGGIKYPERVSQYERTMQQCPQGQERACQEQYEHTFTNASH